MGTFLLIVYIISMIVLLADLINNEARIEDYSNKDISELFLIIFLPVVNTIAAIIIITDLIENK